MSDSTKHTDTGTALDTSASPPCDAQLREALRLEQERLWRAEHADFIAAHNVAVEAEGLPLEAWKTF